jgi:hypothetical protein
MWPFITNHNWFIWNNRLIFYKTNLGTFWMIIVFFTFISMDNGAIVMTEFVNEET